MNENRLFRSEFIVQFFFFFLKLVGLKLLTYEILIPWNQKMEATYYSTK